MTLWQIDESLVDGDYGLDLHVLKRAGVLVPVEPGKVRDAIRGAAQYAADWSAWSSPLDAGQIDDIADEALEELGIGDAE